MLTGCSTERLPEAATHKQSLATPNPAANISKAQEVVYKDRSGNTLTVDAIPGQLILFAKPGTDPKAVKDEVSRLGGRCIDDGTGYSYSVEVAIGEEGAFIEKTRAISWIKDVSPNILGATH